MKLTLGKTILVSLTTLAFCTATAYAEHAEQCPTPDKISFDNVVKQYKTSAPGWQGISPSETGDLNIKLKLVTISKFTAQADTELVQCTYGGNDLSFVKAALHVTPVEPNNGGYQDSLKDWNAEEDHLTLTCHPSNKCEFAFTEPYTDNPFKAYQWAFTMQNRVKEVLAAYDAAIKSPGNVEWHRYNAVATNALKVQKLCYEEVPNSPYCSILNLPRPIVSEPY